MIGIYRKHQPFIYKVTSGANFTIKLSIIYHLTYGSRTHILVSGLDVLYTKYPEMETMHFLFWHLSSLSLIISKDPGKLLSISILTAMV
ncbi:hypothetical protein FKM82_004924 [Ascaphus truei]